MPMARGPGGTSSGIEAVSSLYVEAVWLLARSVLVGFGVLVCWCVCSPSTGFDLLSTIDEWSHL